MSKLGIVMLEANEDGQHSMLEPKHVLPLDKFKELLFKDFKEWLDEEA